MTTSPPSRASEMPKAYDPGTVEDRIYAMWEANGHFHPRPGGKPFTIIMPPPNVTGALHLGHALTTTVEDLLTRWHRMLGDEALWLPGLDHAGIATQSVVERELAKEGLTRHDLGREDFVERVWQWVGRYRSRIENQLRKMGASADWEKTVFTLDEGPHDAVRKTFASLHAAGKIYRGHRIINWDPEMRTAVSELEVEHQEEAGHLWHVRYPFVDERGKESTDGIVIATTRPETIPADVAIAVNPKDDRYQDLIGRAVRVPLPGFSRTIPVIADAAVEIEFGTGALKITPGHDPLDFEIGERHGLESIRVIDWDGTLTSDAGIYVGLDREEARTKVAADLEEGGYLIKVEDYVHSVGHSQRSGTVVEPLVSTQWFADMEELAGKAAAVVRDGKMRIVPDRFAKVYLQWMDNIRPWCISRQLWWGHRIPAWYCLSCDGEHIQASIPQPNTDEVAAGSVAELVASGISYQTIITQATDVTVGEAAQPLVDLDDPDSFPCPRCGAGPLMQDPDVLDTWFSSGLWPHSTLGWPNSSTDLDRYYPSQVMETGYDILFFWVARMVMLSLHNMGDERPPFEAVYLHGLVRDPQGRKMSKSLNNSVDPLEVSAQYGTDALRFMLATGSSPGNDMKLTDERLEGARNFANKLWNGARFVIGELGDREVEAPTSELNLALEDRWILSRCQRLCQTVDDLLTQFQLGEAGRQIYDFMWSEFFDWYVEASKVRLRDGDATPLPVLAHVLDVGLRLLHPFMPFVTEEIWQQLRSRLSGIDDEALIIAPYPRGTEEWIDDDSEAAFLVLQDTVRAIRQIRADRNVEPGRFIEAYVVDKAGDGALLDRAALLETLARARPLHIVSDRSQAPTDQVVTQILDRAEVVLPLGGLVDPDAERARIEKEIGEAQKYLQRLQGKLSNEGFRSKAPAEVVAKEEEKARETEGRIDALRAELGQLG